MAETSEAEGVRYRRFVRDPSLLAVLSIGGAAALGGSAVPVALPGIAAALGLAEAQLGLVMGAFHFAGLLALPVVSLVADVHGRRRVVIPSLLLLGTAGLATLVVTDYRTLLLLRVLQGVGFAGTVPLTPTLIGDLYTRGEGSAAQGIRSGVNGLAAVVGPPIAGLFTVIAWQYPFLLYVGTLPVAGLVYRYYPEPVRPRGTGGAGVSVVAGLQGYVREILESADRRVGLMTLGGFALFFLKGGFTTFLPVFAVAGLGSSVTVAGTLLGMYGGVRMLVAPLSGSIMVRLGRKATMLAGTGLATLGIGVIPFVPGVWLLGLAVVIFSLGEAVLNPVISDAVATAAADDRRAGTMSGLQMLKQIAITVSPVALGFVIGAAGYTTAFLGAATLGLAYGLVILAGLSPVEPTR